MEKLNPKRRRTGLLEAAAISIPTFLSSLDSGPAKALEIDPATSWVVGVTDNIRNTVMDKKETVESQVSYILFKDGSGTWPHVAKGELVPSKKKESRFSFRRDSGTELAYIRTHHTGKEILKPCRFHTHNQSIAIVKDTAGNEYHLKYAPPSHTDLEYKETEQSWKWYAALQGMPVKEMVFGVADPSGIHYYQTHDQEKLNDSDRQHEWKEAYNDFIKKSVRDVNFDFKKEYSALQKAYENLGAEVHFVPYEEVPNKQVCSWLDREDEQKVSKSVHQETEGVSSHEKKSDDGWGPAAKAFGVGS
jgi:hypothetical protein